MDTAKSIKQLELKSYKKQIESPKLTRFSVLLTDEQTNQYEVQFTTRTIYEQSLEKAIRHMQKVKIATLEESNK